MSVVMYLKPGPGSSGGSGAVSKVGGHIKAGGSSAVNVRPGDRNHGTSPLNMVVQIVSAGER